MKIAKKYNGIEYALLAVENQEGVHYAMPVRVMGYDHYTYNKQYQDRKKYYKDNNIPLTGDEFISGIRKNDKFVPVFTLVLYYGEEEWDGPKCLHDMLDIPNEMKSYINNYTINVVELKKNNLNLQNKNNIDLFKIMSIVYDMNRDRQERKQLLSQYEANQTIDECVVDAIASITKMNINYNKAGERKMCTLWDEVREEGREEGIKTEIFSSVQEGDYGVKRGAEKLGITEEEFIKRMEAAGGGEYSVTAYSEREYLNHMDGVRCILVGPQVRYLKDGIRKDINNQCPVESINPRDYGMMNGERALAQAKQLIADFYA